MFKTKLAAADVQRGCKHTLRMGAPPEPPTSIFIVPFGPRLVRMTSCRPLAALMFMNRAAVRPITSALELRDLTAMAPHLQLPAGAAQTQCLEGPVQAAVQSINARMSEPRILRHA